MHSCSLLSISSSKAFILEKPAIYFAILSILIKVLACKLKPLAYQFMNEEVRKYLREIASKGGSKGVGKAKARTTEQARAAANKRWKRASNRPVLEKD